MSPEGGPYAPLFHEHTQEELRRLKGLKPLTLDPGRNGPVRADSVRADLPEGAGTTPEGHYFWQRTCTVCGGPVYLVVERRWYDGDREHGARKVNEHFARWDGLGCDACSVVCAEDLAALEANQRGERVYVNVLGLCQRTNPAAGGYNPTGSPGMGSRLGAPRRG
jgi:hypothetical protein